MGEKYGVLLFGSALEDRAAMDSFRRGCGLENGGCGGRKGFVSNEVVASW